MADALLDLGMGDVHRAATVAPDTERPAEATMSDSTDLISAEKRKSIPDDKFALPAQRKYPLDTAARTRNAAARLEQMHKRGKVSDADYAAAKGRIARAAKKHGIDSEYNKPKKSGKAGSLSIDVRHLAPGGSLHVRHNMTTGAVSAFLPPIALVTTLRASAERPSTEALTILETPLMGTDPKDWKWQQIAKPGTFRGHSQGRAFEFNGKVFDQLIANFEADGQPVLWDFEHASEQEPTEGTIPVNGAPAQGWIHKLDNRGPAGLWALTEWGAQAKEYIDSGKYKFCSPAIVFESKDRETGKPIGPRLTSVALTGSPFLAGMRPLTASSKQDAVATLMRAGWTQANAEAEATRLVVQLGTKDPMGRTLRAPADYMPQLRACLGLHELSTHDDCNAQLTRLSERCALMGDDFTHEGVDLRAKYLNGLAECAGMGGNPGVQDILDAVQDMIDAAIDEHVDEYHGGSARMSTHAAPNDTPQPLTPEDPPMPTEAEHTTLKTKALELEGQVTLLTGKVKNLEPLEAQVTTLTAKATTLGKAVDDTLTLLKAHGVTVGSDETLDGIVKRVLEQNKTLLSAKTARDEADIVADVDRAMSHYGPLGLKQVRDEQKPDLLTLRRESPKSFLALYKPLSADEIRLLSTATPRPPPRKVSTVDAGDPVMLSHSALTARLMSTEKLGYDEATEKATLMIREARAAS